MHGLLADLGFDTETLPVKGEGKKRDWENGKKEKGDFMWMGGSRGGKKRELPTTGIEPVIFAYAYCDFSPGRRENRVQVQRVTTAPSRHVLLILMDIKSDSKTFQLSS